MAEDTSTQHHPLASPGKDLEKSSVDPPPTPTSLGTVTQLDPLSSDDNKGLSELASIDTGHLIALFGLLTNFEKSKNNLWVSNFSPE